MLVLRVGEARGVCEPRSFVELIADGIDVTHAYILSRYGSDTHVCHGCGSF